MRPVRSLADLGRGDLVQTRGTKRFGVVKGFEGGAVVVLFSDDAEEATLLPLLLWLVDRARHHAFPPRFFADGGVRRAMKNAK